jgi:hypothetical protein
MATAVGGGLLLATRLVAAQAECDPEICVAVNKPPPCMEENLDFDTFGCPADFEASGMDFCFDNDLTGHLGEVDPSIIPPGGFPTRTDRGTKLDEEQIYSILQDGEEVDCGIVRVIDTGYYAIYDKDLAESCSDQLDESGFLTVHNSCNPDGYANQANVDDMYVVTDVDNTGRDCAEDPNVVCGPGLVCNEHPQSTHGSCCVPDAPTYMGTFLLTAGEANVICIRHWCQIYLSDPTRYANTFVSDRECGGSVNSIHFRMGAGTFVCRQEGYLQSCMGGCVDGGCIHHPCYDHQCPAGEHCQMNPATKAAECVAANPCGNITCEYGCLFGLCLQGQAVRGPDADGDGYSRLADCDDNNPAANPGVAEVMGNGVDDNCDGLVDDEVASPVSSSGSGGSDTVGGGAVGGSGQAAAIGLGGGQGQQGQAATGNDASTGLDAAQGQPATGDATSSGANAMPIADADDGCGCRAASRAGGAPGVVLVLAGLLAAIRRSRRRLPQNG